MSRSLVLACIDVEDRRVEALWVQGDVQKILTISCITT